MLQRDVALEEGIYHSQLDLGGKMPLWTFLPQAYEPGYAYPLLVFLHGHGQTESQWMRAIPHLSRRNYLGIALRGPHTIIRPNGYLGFGWGRHRRSESAIEDYVLLAIEETRQIVNVHPGRIFIAGVCEGATIAYQLGLSLADRFAGIIAIQGALPAGPLPLARWRGVHRTSVFIGNDSSEPSFDSVAGEDAVRVLTSAGVPVEHRTCPHARHLPPTLLRDVDRWVMGQCHPLSR